MPKKAFYALDEERRRDLIDRAMRIHIDHAYEDITLKLLLDALELNPATFYRYFDDRDDLYIHMLGLLEEKLDKHVEDKHPELLDSLFYESVTMADVLTPLELAFENTLVQAPDYILIKFYTGVGKDSSFEHCKSALRKMRYDGELRGQVDDDLISYIFATSLLNLALFYREFGITDTEMQYKIRRYFYRDFFRYGIMSKRPEDGEPHLPLTGF